MSTPIWRGPESSADEVYPLALLKYLLRQMVTQFSAQGVCIALYDESVGQMRVYAHGRLASVSPHSAGPSTDQSSDTDKTHNRRATIKLLSDSVSSGSLAKRNRGSDELVDVTPQQCELFAVGSAYPIGQDLIGYVWHKNEVYSMRHEDYLTLFHSGRPLSMQVDVTPQSYLVIPIREATLVNEFSGRYQAADVIGVIILYQVNSSAPSLSKQRTEALNYVERIALYLQNDRLQRAQRRTNEYLKLLQGLSASFPTSVKLADLIESMYQVTSRVVDVSSMLLTLYDRDLDRFYDVFAVRDGVRVKDAVENPRVMRKEERPVLWRTTQQAQPDKRVLLFSPAQDLHMALEHQELLAGIWGDQRQAESFLLLPMKMLNRVVGSLCITSMRANAYHPEEIQVLETMTQIVTVSVENAKLYERDRDILYEARQREAQLAGINSALQSISTVLNVTELLNNLVQSVADIVHVEICAFFELTPAREALFAHALYAKSSVRMVDDGSGLPIEELSLSNVHNDQLINMIQLPFKGTDIEQMVSEGFFYLDTPRLAELAKASSDGGAMFLREMGIQQMLMLPMSYHSEFLGILAVPTPPGSTSFRPKDVATLLAISAQAASAIRNAQLFEQREEAYAEMEHLGRLKDEFLVTASHELRTPLTAISGYSSQLKRQSARANPQQISRFANKIFIATQQLIYLVSSMTEAAQMGAINKRLDLHIEPVQIRAAIEIAQNMVMLNAEQNHIELDVSPDFWVEGDAPRVRQVLTNLLENATKYSPPDSPIQVSAYLMQLSEIEDLLSKDQADPTLLLEQGDIPVVLIQVKDHGEGILPQDSEHIFEKFVRAPRSLTTAVRGSGLGLYICRRSVEAMGGKLWLEKSVPNEGSTFSFYLPYIEPPVEVGE